jgi:cell fate (sporulation/competence/biofilm development) regulator YlbF (YheA/YmcA/DUF963 family)
MSSGGYFYTVTNDNTSTTEELLEQFDNFDKKQKEFEEKRKNKQQGEEEDPAAVFRYAHFICTRPLGPRIAIPRDDVGSIQAHKESCDHCQEKERKKREEQALKYEGPQRLEYILHEIKRAKETIEEYERKKAEVERKREKGEEELDGWEIEKVRRAEYDAGTAKRTIEKERIELHKLLNHENEVIRKGAQEAYQKRFPKAIKDFVEKTLGKPLLFSEEEAEKEYEEAYEWWRKISIS